MKQTHFWRTAPLLVGFLVFAACNSNPSTAPNNLTADEALVSNPNGRTTKSGNLSAQAVGDGLKVTFWDNQDFTGTTQTRTDPTVDLTTTGSGTTATSPITGIAGTTWSARWEGFVQAPTTGAYTFYITSDDGGRLSVNNNQIINNWTDHFPVENSSAAINLTAGQFVPIKLEQYNGLGGARMLLSWSGPGIAKVKIPQAQLSTSIPVTTTGEFQHSSGFNVYKTYNSAYWGSFASQINTPTTCSGQSACSKTVDDMYISRSRPDGIKVVQRNGLNVVQMAIKDGFTWGSGSGGPYDRAQLDHIGPDTLDGTKEWEFIFKLEQSDAPIYPGGVPETLIGFQVHDNSNGVNPWGMYNSTYNGGSPKFLWRDTLGGSNQWGTVLTSPMSAATAIKTYRIRYKPSSSAGFMYLEEWNGTGWTQKFARTSGATTSTPGSDFINLSFYDFNRYMVDPGQASRGREFRYYIYHFSMASK